MRQVSLLAAGCQPWNRNVCCVTKDKFAYAATLAIYIYQVDKINRTFRLHSIMSEHKKTIMCIEWHPQDDNLIGSSSMDPMICIWNIKRRSLVATLNKPSTIPSFISWCRYDCNILCYVDGKGPLYFWKYTKVQKNSNTSSLNKDPIVFSSPVSQMKWHPTHGKKFIIGHENGTVSLINKESKPMKHLKLIDKTTEFQNDESVCQLQWDSNSSDYILVANKAGRVLHVDVSQLSNGAVSIIGLFNPPSAAVKISSMSWLSGAPGLFVTGDHQSGILRLWNVSSSSPMENITLHESGFHAISSLSAEYEEPVKKSNSISHVSSTGEADPNMNRSYRLPNCQIVCLFSDGGVGSYDLAKRKWDFLKSQGHIETIFDCQFKPNNCDLLATASFDGSIKVWNVNDMVAENHSLPMKCIIYSISWAPSDLNCIAAATSSEGILIWNVDKSTFIKKFKTHGSSRVFSVAWHQKDSRRIASAGEDNNCIIQKADGTILQICRHPATVYCCDWNPTNIEMLATACEDNLVRVYYLPKSDSDPVKIFSGHTGKVFRVQWNPIQEGILCSSSDDCTVRVWNLNCNDCIAVLNGHKSYVRGILWNPEIPYILMTSSWDATIRTWDIRDKTCIEVNSDHGSDVYGLATHPVRPFMIASSSRDSTVRLWLISSNFNPLHLRILCGESWKNICGSPDQLKDPTSDPLLCGKQSKIIAAMSSSSSKSSQMSNMMLYSEFFGAISGESNLFDLLLVQLGSSDEYNEKSFKCGIMHREHLPKHKNAIACQMEMAKINNTGIKNKNVGSTLMAAAEMHASTGNLRRYCELMIEVGQWDIALSIAPAVSMSYWKSLAKRRAKLLLSENSAKAMAYCVAAGMLEEFVDFQLESGQFDSAFELTLCSDKNCFEISETPASEVFNKIKVDERCAQKSVDALSARYFDSGMPIKAACCFLATDNIGKAIETLLRGNELELVITLGIALGRVDHPAVQEALVYLSKRCKKLGLWELGMKILSISKDMKEQKELFCMNCPLSISKRQELFKDASLPDIDECSKIAKDLEEREKEQAIKFYLLSNDSVYGLNLGLHTVRDMIVKSNWKGARELVNILSSIQEDKLQSVHCESMRYELLALGAYFGALEAIYRNYKSIVPSLFQHSREIFLKASSNNWAEFSENTVRSEYESWQFYHKYVNNEKFKKSNAHQNHIFNNLMSKVGNTFTGFLSKEEVKTTGSNLPSYSNKHLNILDCNVIQGHTYFLDEDHRSMNLNEAIMWARVNPFSPSGTGIHINPF